MKPITKIKKLNIVVRQYAPNHSTINIKDIGVLFISYNSKVAFRDRDGKITLGEDWDYSRTTVKYLGQWLGKSKNEIRQELESGRFEYDKDL